MIEDLLEETKIDKNWSLVGIVTLKDLTQKLINLSIDIARNHKYVDLRFFPLKGYEVKEEGKVIGRVIDKGYIIYGKLEESQRRKIGRTVGMKMKGVKYLTKENKIKKGPFYL